MAFRNAVLGAALLLLCVFGASRAMAADALSFAVIADMPYVTKEGDGRPAFRRLVEKIAEHTPQPDFTVHLGDTIKGRRRCTPEYFREVKNTLNRLPGPWLIVPGDNDWVDCATLRRPFGVTDRPLPADIFQARRAFFPVFYSVGENADNLNGLSGLRMQQGQPANYLWSLGPAVFLTLHLVRWDPDFLRGNRLSDRAEMAKAKVEFFARARDNKAWLDEAVQTARANNNEVIYIFAHSFAYSWPGGPELNRTTGVREFFDYLLNTARDAPGLDFYYVYGDLHRFRPPAALFPDEDNQPKNLKAIGMPGHPDYRAVIFKLNESTGAPDLSLIGPGTARTTPQD